MPSISKFHLFRLDLSLKSFHIIFKRNLKCIHVSDCKSRYLTGHVRQINCPKIPNIVTTSRHYTELPIVFTVSTPNDGHIKFLPDIPILLPI